MPTLHVTVDELYPDFSLQLGAPRYRAADFTIDLSDDEWDAWTSAHRAIAPIWEKLSGAYEDRG